MDSEKKIKLSICCLTYNHEPYLRKALDGILMQDTNFEYEVIIGEDCSTDNSRRIIDEYVEKNPGIFTVIYRDKNVGTCQNMNEVFDLAKGEYFCILETDDYWCDSKKLQMQIDWLDNHPECIAVSHVCKMVDENDNLLNIKYPQITEGYYTWDDYRHDIMPGQTASIVCRNYYAKHLFDTSIIDKTAKDYGPGDRRRAFMMLEHGKVYCIDREMSCYRFVRKGGASYTANNKFNYEQQILYYKEFVEYAKRINASNEAIRTAESLYIRAIWIAFLHRQKEIVSLKTLIKAYKSIQYKLASTLDMLCFYWNRITKQRGYYYQKV